MKDIQPTNNSDTYLQRFSSITNAGRTETDRKPANPHSPDKLSLKAAIYTLIIHYTKLEVLKPAKGTS